MAVKSIIDIDLNDSAFKRFTAAWAAWRKQAEKPLASLSKDVSVLKSQTEVMSAQTAFLRAQRKLEQEKEESLGRQLSIWGAIATRTRDFSDRLRGVHTLLTRMGVGTAIAGILGVGSLWGLDRLAGTVGAGRRGAQGLGVSYGQARAFNLNFERLVDAPGLLSGVAGALASPGGAVPFGYLGLDQQAMQRKGAAGAGVDVIKALKHIADTKPERLWSSIIQAGQLDRFNVSTEDFRRLRATSPGELKGFIGSYGADVRTLNVSEKAQKALQDFAIQMDRVGGRIETIFGERLAKLAPGLTHLSDSVAKALDTFLGKADGINTGLTKFGQGIEQLAVYVGSDDFQTKIKNFVTGVGELTDSVLWALRKLGIISTPAAAAGTGPEIRSSFGGFKIAPGQDNVFGNAASPATAGGSVSGAGLGGGVSGAGLNMELALKLHALREAAQRDVGESGRLTSGFRSYEEQAALYANRGSNRYPVARPGFSQHERGLAADIAGSQRFMEYVHAHAAEYGLNFPHANDPVHVQLSNPRVDIRIDNPAGANVFSTTNSVGQAQ